MTDYGTDLSCLSDLTPTMQLVSGPDVVVQAAYRRITTPMGGLLSAPSATTVDVRDLVDSTLVSGSTAYFNSQISQAIEADDRVFSADVSSTITDELVTSEVKITLSTGETFALVLAVSSLTVELLKS